jgi:hypothetical protein
MTIGDCGPEDHVPVRGTAVDGSPTVTMHCQRCGAHYVITATRVGKVSRVKQTVHKLSMPPMARPDNFEVMRQFTDFCAEEASRHYEVHYDTPEMPGIVAPITHVTHQAAAPDPTHGLDDPPLAGTSEPPTVRRPFDVMLAEFFQTLERERLARLRRRLVWAVGVATVMAAVLAGLNAFGVVHLHVPSATKTADRQAVLLLAEVNGLGRFAAATGDFQAITDLQAHPDLLPDLLINQKLVLVAVGSVSAFVDLSTVLRASITISTDGTAATIRVPRVQFEPPVIDLDHTYIHNSDNGYRLRISDLGSAQESILQLASQQISAESATGDLRQRAQQNIRLALERLTKTLGYATVVVEFPNA